MRKRGLSSRAARLSSSSYDCADTPAARLAAIGCSAQRAWLQARGGKRPGSVDNKKRTTQRRIDAYRDFAARTGAIARPLGRARLLEDEYEDSQFRERKTATR